jgi:type III secretion protein U
MSDDKTEDPTDKKLKDSRKDGKVSHSRDLSDAISFFAPIGILAAMTNYLRDHFRSIVTLSLEFSRDDHSLTNIMTQTYDLARLMIGAVLPVLGAAALASFVSSVAQVGFQISMKPVAPKIENISPVNGFKKIFSIRTLIDLAKMLIKGTVVIIVMWKSIESMIPLLAMAPYQPLPVLAMLLWHIVLRLLMFAAAVFVVFGVVDIKIQKKIFLKDLKMSKDEVKREFKESEGDPMIKGERRRIARELALSPPPSQKVATANVLVVNPTHYAVAVRYQPREHPLPRVIAKAVDDAVVELRRAALDAGVPIIGNPPVARALYGVGIDEPIPPALFESVAAILRWVETIGPDAARAENSQ